MDWFKHRRLLEPIGNIPPVEYEERYYEAETAPAVDTQSKSVVKCGKEFPEGRIDVHNRPQSADLGSVHTSSTP